MAQRGKNEVQHSKGSIDGMKDSLYSRQHAPILHPDHRTLLDPEGKEHPPVTWEDAKIEPDTPKTSVVPEPTSPKPRMSFAIKFFIASFAFFVGAIGVAGYMFFVGSNTVSPQNIDLQVIAPTVIDGGKPTTFQVLINNRNQSPLQLVDLSIDYPDNTRDSVDQTIPLQHERQSIGGVTAGQQIKRTADAVFYGQEGSQQKIVVTLQYSVANSNAIFQKQAEADFTVGSAPVSVVVDAPAEAISGQQFTMNVSVTNNTQAPIQNFLLQGEYPFGYTLQSATPPSEPSGNLWRLNTLSPGQTKQIQMVGTILGQDGDQRVFKFSTGSDADQTDTTIKVPFIVVPQTLTVHKPFISATLTLNGSQAKSVAIQAGKSVDGIVTWQNNLDVPVSNVQLVLSLSGPALDKTSVSSSNGFYQSTNNTITWDNTSDSDFASVPPGGTGKLQFTFSTLAPGTNGTVYTNPTVDFNLKVAGVRQGQSGVPETVSSAATTEATVASAVQLTQSALHFTGPFANSGPMPPMAEKSTTYTVVWTLLNSSNTIANATVSAILPSYVTYLSSQDPNVTYEQASRRVTWAMGNLKAGVGFSAPPQTTAFQVSLLPSGSQVGQKPLLTGDATFAGQDRFAQVTVQATAPGADTALIGDTGYTDAMANVQAAQ